MPRLSRPSIVTRALVVVQHGEIEAVHALDVLQLAAGDVADTGPFDLDHVSAQPGEKLRAGGAGLDMGELQNAARCRVLSSSRGSPCFVGVVALGLDGRYSALGAAGHDERAV